jgi:hypothetical protein
MDHRTFRELAAGAALDDLDAAERTSLDAHLSSCSPCRDEARGLVDTAGLLAYAVPSRRAPASLRSGILAAISASEGRPVGVPAATLAYAGSNPTMAAPSSPIAPAGRLSAPSATTADIVEIETLRRERTRYRRLSFAGLAAAAVLAIAVGALGTSAVDLGDQLARTATERDVAVAQLARTDQAMAVVLAPDHATAQLTTEPMAAEASVYVVYRPGTTEAWLMAGNLPEPPAGQVYQLWSADAAGVHALTTFTCGDSGSCLAPFGVDLADSTATMITLEPAGGSQGEPGPQVAFGELEG